MKVFKRIDCVVQGFLIVAGIIMALASGDMMSDFNFFGAYFLVGGWQLVSVFVHFFYQAPYKTRMRKVYLVSLGLVILALLVSIPTEMIIGALFGLLFVSPVLAVFYLATCIVETQRLLELAVLPAGAGSDRL